MNAKQYMIEKNKEKYLFSKEATKTADEKSNYTYQVFCENIEEIDNLFLNIISPQIILIYDLANTVNEFINNKETSNLERINTLIKYAREIQDKINIGSINRLNDLKNDFQNEIRNFKKAVSSFCGSRKKKLMMNTFVINMRMKLSETGELFEEYINEYLYMLNELNEADELLKQIENTFNNYLNGLKVNKINIPTKSKDSIVFTYEKMMSFLNYKGFEKIRQNGTSHAIFKNANGISIPMPNKKGDMFIGTAMIILKQIGSNKTEYYKYIIQN